MGKTYKKGYPNARLGYPFASDLLENGALPQVVGAVQFGLVPYRPDKFRGGVDLGGELYTVAGARDAILEYIGRAKK